MGFIIYMASIECFSNWIGHVLIARGHPLSIIVGALASPITSLNPSLAAGWFAGYTQLKMNPPTGKDASDFLEFSSMYKCSLEIKLEK